MKFKYWTACATTLQGKTILTHKGQPFTNIRDAKREMRDMNSSSAVVVTANSEGFPTTKIVATK